jgi:hypothetical protein
MGTGYKIMEKKNIFTPHITYKKQINKNVRSIFFVRKQINILTINGSKNAITK